MHSVQRLLLSTFWSFWLMTVCCFPMVHFLRRFRCKSRGRRCGKRPESFLTPYEMDMVPFMLKELLQVNPRFFETVSFRWFREAISCSARCDTATDRCGSSISGHSTCSVAPPATMHEFENEGVALEELVRCAARSLMDKGTFDEECEKLLLAYRNKREQWRCTNMAVATTATLAAPTLLRSRSFSATVAAPPITSSRFCAAFGADKAAATKKSSLPSRLSRLTRRNRALTSARQADVLFIQLGEVLVHQYQCSIGVDKDGSVHERELKLLIWRHFVQMLIAILTDRMRFPCKPPQRF